VALWENELKVIWMAKDFETIVELLDQFVRPVNERNWDLIFLSISWSFYLFKDI
jgi:hypothetical protein